MPDAKIDVIAHGIPDTPFVDPNPYKEQFGVEGRLVALTFGLLSPNKGIEHMLRAVPEILKTFPNFVYIVLGATHPDLVRDQGERYRLSLERLARDARDRASNVIFYNRFVELKELTEFIRAADVYVTPYLNPAQITSGTLAYSFGCGKAVVSTPYWHAEELLADGRGVLVPFADPTALAREVGGLLGDEPRRAAMCEDAYRLGREMIWEQFRATTTWSRSSRRVSAGRISRSSRWPSAPSPSSRTSCPTGGSTTWFADDRRDRDAPARHAHHPELRGGLLHRRQRPRAVADRSPGGTRARRDRRSSGSHPATPRSCRPRSTRNRSGSATSSASTAAGWKRSGRRTRTAGRCGRWAPASAVRAGPTCPAWAASHFELALAGRSWKRPRREHGPSVCSASASTSAGSAATGTPPRPATRSTARLRRHLRPHDDPGLAVVRGDPQLRHRPPAAGADRRRPRERQRPRAGSRAALARLAGRRSRPHRRNTSGRSASNGFYRKGGERARFDQQPIEAARRCRRAWRRTG